MVGKSASLARLFRFAPAASMSQSDRAAQALSQKLLQGWTMLGESCAHPTAPCNVR